MFNYDNHHDANQYLSGSYMLYDGVPIHIMEIREDMSVIYKVVGESEHKIGGIAHLESRQLPLGYAYDDIRNNCYYFERMPSRSFRQGLSPTNIQSKGDRGRGVGIRDISVRELLRMFTNNYRSIEDAREEAIATRNEVPFHRAMTIDWNNLVKWKTQVVGEWVNEGVSLMSRFTYLKETIEGEGYNVS